MTVFQAHNVQCIFNVSLEGRTCTRYKIHFKVLQKRKLEPKVNHFTKKAAWTRLEGST